MGWTSQYWNRTESLGVLRGNPPSSFTFCDGDSRSSSNLSHKHGSHFLSSHSDNLFGFVRQYQLQFPKLRPEPAGCDQSYGRHDRERYLSIQLTKVIMDAPMFYSYVCRMCMFIGILFSKNGISKPMDVTSLKDDNSWRWPLTKYNKG